MGSIGGDVSGSLVMSKSHQGIVSILGAAGPGATLRRTMSADMMSKTWLAQNGFVSNMKKIASSDELSRCISEYSSSSAGEEEEEVIKKEKPADELDIWSLIMSQSQNKDQEQDKSAAPYIHPLVKKSKGALSKKSLEVCTESLGSETGSDGFSDHQSSEIAEEDQLQEQEQEQGQKQSLEYEDVRVVKYNFAAVGKKLPPPCFPPPLATLSPSLRMKPRRENGRLVLEAVSVPKQNNFKAERQDGRLVLTFASQEAENDDKEEAMEEMEEDFGQSSEDDEEQDYETEDDSETEDDYETEEEAEEMEIMLEQATKPSCGVMKLHRLALMMHNPTCPHKCNQVVQFGDEEETLPPVRRLVAASQPNAYDYCWRAKPTAAQAMEKNSHNKHMISKNNSSAIAINDQHREELVVIKSDNYMVPNIIKGCKEHRRSLFREPYCIATS